MTQQCVEKLEAENASLRNQCGDNLCWAQSPAEIQALPKSEHLESCSRYWDQVASERGVFSGGMTIAQLETEVMRLREALKTVYRSDSILNADSKAVIRAALAALPPA